MAILGISVAPEDDVLEPAPDWERLDVTYRVRSWQIDRGRNFEFDRVETGRAVIDIVDDTGDFDPTNTGGSFYGSRDLACKQAAIALQNPTDSSWSTVLRGHVSRVEWEPYQTLEFANVRLYLNDALALLAASEMPPDGTYGDAISDGNVVFDEDTTTNAVQNRIEALLTQDGWSSTLYTIFTGQVKLQRTVYAPRSTVLQVCLDAATADWPGASVFFVDREGIITFHGRRARFFPDDSQYHITRWYLGDDTAALADPTNVVRISPPLVASRDDLNLFTSATATYQGIEGASIAAQYRDATTAITKYGLRTWSAENLLTYGGESSATAADVTGQFGDYIVANYAEPKTRVGAITVRPQNPSGTFGEATWALMGEVDITDIVNLTTTHAGGGGFNGEDFYVEGIHYTARPMSSNQHDVTLTLDVTPAAYWDSDPF